MLSLVIPIIRIHKNICTYIDIDIIYHTCAVIIIISSFRDSYTLSLPCILCFTEWALITAHSKPGKLVLQVFKNNTIVFGTSFFFNKNTNIDFSSMFLLDTSNAKAECLNCSGETKLPVPRCVNSSRTKTNYLLHYCIKYYLWWNHL